MEKRTPGTVWASAWALVLVATAVGAGCGRAKTDRLKVVPAAGKLLVNGRPAANAEVILHPVDKVGRESVRPFARTEADGSFRLSTYDTHDGAPVGQYHVTVVWPSVVKVDGEDMPGPDMLNGRYLKPEQSGLKITVTETSSQLPPLDLPYR
jgi:hypothetical protein